MNNKLIRRIVAALAVAIMLIQIVPVSANAEEGTLSGKTATEITAMMGKGWNLGNTLDAQGGNKTDIYTHETAWGNPKVTKELIAGVKAAGFTTIRIPTTWYNYIDKSNGYQIYPEYMARVTEIVDYAYDEGLFVIINVHHEPWVNRKDIDTAYVEIGKELVAVWEQISDTFADYDQHLIFEGMNEPRAQEKDYEWTGTAACYEAVNYLDQLFVETVRGNGKGYNNERMLMVPGYAASSNPTVLKALKLPEINGETASNICVSVHCYSPYNFCLSDAQTTFDPKNSSDTADIKTLFSNLKSMFISNGIPVVIGECGATNSGDNNSSRLAWFAFMGAMSNDYGIPAIVWDNGANGTSGGECHYYFVRKTGEAYSQNLIDAFIMGSVSLKAENTFIDFEAVKEGTSTTLANPVDLGFSQKKLATQMKTNHTEGIAMGFSLKVDETVADFTADYSIKRYAGHTIRIGAWICSNDGTNVVVGVKDSADTEKANVATTEEWTQVIFDVDVPVSGDCVLYFKGDAKYFVDDISIEMDPTEPLPEVSVPVSEDTQVSEVSASTEDTTVSTETSDTVAATTTVEPATESNGSLVSVIMIVIAVVAVIAVAVIVAGSKKKK